MGDYFIEIIGSKVDYVQVRKTYNGNINDDTIYSILQYKFSEKINKNNINQFINKVFDEDDLELIFYIKDTEK